MSSRVFSSVCAAALIATATVAARVPAPAVGVDQPETVILTAHPKAGQDEAFARVLARHWATAKDLKLVNEAWPHVTLRATDADHRTYFVEIFTWRDASIPDAAPEPILAIWQQMNALVERRGTQPALEITAATWMNRPPSVSRP